MAAVETCLDVCKVIDHTLDDISNGLYSAVQFKDQTFGTAKMINDFARTKITEEYDARPEQPNNPNCTSVNYRITYDIPHCNPASKDCSTVDFDCSPAETNYADCGSDTPTFSNCVADELTFSAADFCLENHTMSVEATKAVERMAYNMYHDYNAQMVDLIKDMPGAFFGETDSSLTAPKALKLFTQDATGRVLPQPIALTDIEKEYRKQNMRYRKGDEVILTGSHYFAALQNSVDLYRGNVDGFDISKASGLGSIYYDPRLASELDKDCAISWLPGSMHLLEYYLFRSPDREIVPGGRVRYSPIGGTTNGTDIRRQVVNLAPFLGMPDSDQFWVDIQVTVDNCNSISPMVTIKAKKLFGLWCPPAEAYCGDYNFKLKWELACAPYTCNDVNC